MKTDQDNTIALGNKLLAGSTTIIDTDGLIPYAAVKGSPSTVTWSTLSGVPATIMYSDQTTAAATVTALTAGTLTASGLVSLG